MHPITKALILAGVDVERIGRSRWGMPAIFGDAWHVVVMHDEAGPYYYVHIDGEGGDDVHTEREAVAVVAAGSWAP